MMSRFFALTNVIKLAQRQPPGALSGIRTLYSASMMGIESFAKVRESQIEHTRDTAERFRSKMIEFVDPNSPNLVFTEDLKLMLNIVDNNKDDLGLLEKMMKKFHNQNKELRFGSFSFGPVVMRLYSLFDLPHEALKLFRDPEMKGFFEQITSFILLCDLLFRHQMYNEVLEVYDYIRDLQIQHMRFPKNLLLLVFASLYKLNTPEAFQKCTDLIKEVDAAGHQLIRRAICVAAALALNQNNPYLAKELTSRVAGQSYVTVRNLKVWAYADLGRPDDALPILRSALDVDAPHKKHQHPGLFLQNIIDKVEEGIVKLDQKEITLEFNRIKTILEQEGAIMDQDIDSLLLAEVHVTPNMASPEKQYFEASYNTRSSQRRNNYDGRGHLPSRGQRRPFNDRPGLRDLV